MSARRREPGWRLTLAAAVLALAAALAPIPSWFVERYYSRGIYPLLQSAVTSLTNLSPIALLDVAGASIVLAGFRAWQRAPRRPAAVVARTITARVVLFCATAYLAFLALWGLNYRRVRLEEKLEFDRSRITRQALLETALSTAKEMNHAYAPAQAGGSDDRALRSAFAEAVRLLAPAARPAVPGVPKASLLGYYFRWAAIDGMTDPFFLEIIVNPDVLPVERPFVVMHEWAHLAGYADEAEANFVAWLACVRGDALARYSGWLELYGHLAVALPREDWQAVRAALEPGPRADLTAIANRLERSTPLVRHAARDVYDAYLKGNRVPGGIARYDAVVQLILGTQFESVGIPRLRHAGPPGQ
jgi:uncharacterized protein DUF3810